MSQTDLLGQPAHLNASSLLATLAVIQVNWSEKRRSYLDQFVPFVLEVMRTAATKRWSDVEIVQGLEDVFGLSLPTRVVDSLLRRASKIKSVSREDNTFLLIANSSAASKSVTAMQADCLRRQAKLIEALVSTVQDTFGLSWAAETAEKALVSYIESHAVPLLAASTRGVSLEAAYGPVGNEYVISYFVSEIARSEPVLFDYLDEMVKGSMLASALYMNVPHPSRRFENTTLYIDTPLCVRALGLDGEEPRDAVMQVLAMASAQGAHIACFEHTVSEIRGILDAALYSLRYGRSRGAAVSLADRFRVAGNTPSDVEKIIDQLRSRLSQVGIEVEDTPDHTARLGVDEEALEGLLATRVGYMFSSAEALHRDLDSLTSVHRLRRGSAPRELEKCKALLVTSNSSLVQVAREFFDKAKHEWPVAMHDNDVAALLWVKQPQQYPDVPRTQVIADCVTALSPSSDLWESVLKEVERLEAQGQVSAEEVAVMRYAPEARNAVMDATLGESRNVSTKSVQEAIRKARDQVSEPVRRELEKTKRLADEAQANQALLDAEHQEELAKRDTELQSARDEASAIRERIKRSATKTGSVIRGVGITVCVVAVLVGVVAIILDLGDVSRWMQALGFGIGVLTGVFGTVTQAFRKQEGRFVLWLERRKLAKLGLRPEELAPELH